MKKKLWMLLLQKFIKAGDRLREYGDSCRWRKPRVCMAKNQWLPEETLLALANFYVIWEANDTRWGWYSVD